MQKCGKYVENAGNMRYMRNRLLLTYPGGGSSGWVGLGGHPGTTPPRVGPRVFTQNQTRPAYTHILVPYTIYGYLTHPYVT
jgi:hypothetical protein